MNIFIQFTLFHLKHFAADFPLQTPFMLGKGKSGFAWIIPLSAHCLVHTVLSLTIILFVRPEMYYLAIGEFIAHFIIDRLKVSYKLPSGPWPSELKGKYLSRYYCAFGLDQLAHQLTYVVIVYYLNT
jgi:hypothetical protein